MPPSAQERMAEGARQYAEQVNALLEQKPGERNGKKMIELLSVAAVENIPGQDVRLALLGELTDDDLRNSIAAFDDLMVKGAPVGTLGKGAILALDEFGTRAPSADDRAWVKLKTGEVELLRNFHTDKAEAVFEDAVALGGIYAKKSLSYLQAIRGINSVAAINAAEELIAKAEKTNHAAYSHLAGNYLKVMDSRLYFGLRGSTRASYLIKAAELSAGFHKTDRMDTLLAEADAMSSNEEDVQALVRYYDSALAKRNNDLDGAIAKARDAMRHARQDTSSVKILMHLADCHESKHDFEAAAEVYIDVYTTYPMIPEAQAAGDLLERLINTGVLDGSKFMAQASAVLQQDETVAIGSAVSIGDQ